MRSLWFLVGFCLMALLLPALVFGAGHSLAWDYPADWDQITGYTIYFTDGANNYNKSILKADTTTDGTTVVYSDIEANLHLGYDVNYDMHIKAYNDTGESGPSNTVSFTQGGYSPPADSLPPPVGSEPSDTSGLTIQ